MLNIYALQQSVVRIDVVTKIIVKKIYNIKVIKKENEE